jgi:signal transduction histidine kinase/TPR repeat protein
MKKCSFFISVLLLIAFFYNTSFCQKYSAKDIDSLIIFINNYKKEDTLIVNRIYDVSFFYCKNVPDKSIEYGKKGVAIADKINYKYGKGLCLQAIGVSYRIKMQLPLALNFLFQALTTFEETGKKNKVAACYTSIGNIYYNQQNYPKALEYYQHALIINNEIGENLGKAQALGNIGMIYFKQLDYEKALNYYNQATETGKKYGNKNVYLTNLANVANVYSIQKNYVKAIECYKISIGLCQEINDKTALAFNMGNLGEMYHSMALDLVKTPDASKTKINDYNKLAIEYLRKSIILFTELKSGNSLSNSLLNLSTVYKEMKDYKNGYECLYDSYFLRDSLFTFENQKKLKDMEDKRDRELKEKEIKILQQEKQTQFAYIILLFVLFIGVLAVSIILFRMNKYKKQTNKELTENKNKIETLNHNLLENNNKLIESEKNLIELNNIKDKFFSIIAHDLRNPISSFKVILESMTENYEDFDEGERIEYLNLLRNSSRYLSDLLENLLTWSRSQRGTLEFSPIEFDIKYLIDNNISLSEQIAISKNINIIQEYPSRLKCFGDINMLSTVMRNLISNAIKFSHKGGEIKVKAYQEKDSNFIVISVSDNGVGMTPEIVQNLFKIDAQITNLGTNDEKGTGLGLILCKEFVEKHGGKIYIDTVIGKGSIFYVKIPIN